MHNLCSSRYNLRNPMHNLRSLTANLRRGFLKNELY